MYKRIRYNATDTIRLEFPWVAVPTAVKITVKNRSGTTVQAQASATVIASDTLASAASAGDTTVTLTTGKTYASGDRIYFAGGRPEFAEIATYASKVITLKRPLEFAHASGSNVQAAFCTYFLDTTTVANYPKGELVSLIWEPQSVDELDFIETGQVLDAYFDVENIEADFSKVYPTEYLVIADRFATYEGLATDKLETELKSRGRNLDKLREPDKMREPLLHLIAWWVHTTRGDEGADNMERAWTAYSHAFESVASADPLWFDENQDDAEDEETEIDAIDWIPMGPGRTGYF